MSGSKLTLLALVLLAFAGNSLLTRAALDQDFIGAGMFSLLRLVAGGILLAFLGLRVSGGVAPRFSDLPGIVSLFVYVAGFSFAYLELGAGLGALLLFGFVQVTVIAAGFVAKDRLSPISVAGLLLAGLGLVILLRPGTEGVKFLPSLLMAGAGIAWGSYTLLGRGAADPIARTARNFLGAAPLAVGLLLLPCASPVTPSGALLAILSGAVTSGLGYALWYRILPTLRNLTAGTTQLLVPPVTALLGAVVLLEPITPVLIGAGILILGGVSLTFVPPQQRR